MPLVVILASAAGGERHHTGTSLIGLVMISDTELGIHVHVAPMRPVPDPPAQEAGIRPMWSPCSSTLITAGTEALLVDTLITFDQVDALAEWTKGFGKNLVGVLLTHGHSDHWIGLSRLREHFPDLRGLATKDVLERAQFEAANLGPFWQGFLPARFPSTRFCRNFSTRTRSASTVSRCRSSTSGRETSSTPPSCTFRRSTPSSPATCATTKST